MLRTQLLPQTHPDIPIASLWIVFSRAYHAIAEFLEAGVAVHGTHFSDFIVMEVLLHKGPLSLAAISEKTNYSSASIIPTVERLEQRALVQRRLGRSGEASSLVVDLTETGRKLIQELFDLHERDIAAVMQNVTTEERAQLYEGLKKIGLRAHDLRFEQFEDRKGGLAPWQLRRATEHMARNLTASGLLAEVARTVGLSQAQFYRSFKISTGVPPYQWQLNLRIAKAKELLRDGVLPIAEIALATGFAEQSHFSRVFRKAVGVSPGAWQRDHRR
jgi:AraC-like DNA-binding protein